MAQPAQYAPCQGGFAGPQVAAEIHHHARRETRRQGRPQGECGSLVGQRTGKLGGMSLHGSNQAVTEVAPLDWTSLAQRIKTWARELGFQQAGIADCDLAAAEPRLLAWLKEGRHGEMDYMVRHGTARSRPAELVPGTLRVISVRMDYLPPAARPIEAVLAEPARAAVARYALGRDYHKVLRNRLQQLADRITAAVGEHPYRVFTDSAPVLEVALAANAGVGWRCLLYTSPSPRD